MMADGKRCNNRNAENYCAIIIIIIILEINAGEYNNGNSFLTLNLDKLN